MKKLLYFKEIIAFVVVTMCLFIYSNYTDIKENDKNNKTDSDIVMNVD